jgi:hypothetical protein
MKTIIAILFCACALSACAVKTPTPTKLPTRTSTATATASPVPTATATPTPVPTPTVAPVQRAPGDVNGFPVGSREWRAWNWYDTELRARDAEAKRRGEVGLTDAEQIQIWLNALRRYGVE